MRLRSRRKGVRRGAAVLSAPGSGSLAKRAVKRSSVDSKPPGGHPSDDNGVINAFWSKRDLTLVLRDSRAKNGIRFRRIVAEHSCFVKRSDMPDPKSFYRMLVKHPSVRKVQWEGDWLRIAWVNRDAVRLYCKRLEADKDDKKRPRDPIPTYEGVVSPVLRYMVDNELWPVAPRVIWFDIETDSRVPFSRKEEMRILCWVAIDSDGQVFRGLLNEDTDEDERRLLNELWDVLDHYDQVAAWNGDRFDFPVVKARSERYDLLRSSLREWRRWLWLDQLDLFRRMNMSAAESGDEKQSFALGAVAVSLLGVGKLDFDTSKTWEAWEAGGDRRRELLDYCEQDTALMPRIEDKTGFMALLQTVANTCGTFPDSRGSNPGIQVEGFLARLAHESGHKFPTVLKMRTGDQYEGAFVMHPKEKAGVHRGVHVADFASLYPTIIRTWNMSPETIVDLDCEDDYATSPTIQFGFRTDVDGILARAVKKLMELRKFWNDKKASFPPGTDSWKDADRRSSAYKIAANSFYGVIGAPSSRHYDPRVAESVTKCGKWLIQETIKAAELRGMACIYGDTDSVFVSDVERPEFEEFVGWCNRELYPAILEEHGCVENCIKLAYEKEFDRLVFTTAKRYVGSYTHYKGKDADEDSKPEIKGLEFKRGDSIRLTRRLQEEICYALVSYHTDVDPDDPHVFEEIVQRWLTHVLDDELDVEDLQVTKKLNKELPEYRNNAPMVRIAREMEERGLDVGEGAKVSYVIVDASQSPQVVMSIEDWLADESRPMDREALWDKQIWPPTRRLLEAAFPDHKWSRFSGLVAARRRRAREAAKRVREAEKAAEKAARAEQRANWAPKWLQSRNRAPKWLAPKKVRNRQPRCV